MSKIGVSHSKRNLKAKGVKNPFGLKIDTSRKRFLNRVSKKYRISKVRKAKRSPRNKIVSSQVPNIGVFQLGSSNLIEFDPNNNVGSDKRIQRRDNYVVVLGANNEPKCNIPITKDVFEKGLSHDGSKFFTVSRRTVTRRSSVDTLKMFNANNGVQIWLKTIPKNKKISEVVFLQGDKQILLLWDDNKAIRLNATTGRRERAPQ